MSAAWWFPSHPTFEDRKLCVRHVPTDDTMVDNLAETHPPASPQESSAGKTEGIRVANAVEDLEFFVTDVMCGDSMRGVEEASRVFVERAPDVGIVMLSAGTERLIVHAAVPASRASDLSGADTLVREAIAGMPATFPDVPTATLATAVVEAEGSSNAADGRRDPLADKDQARTAVATYMQENGLFGDSDEEEDEYPGAEVYHLG